MTNVASKTVAAENSGSAPAVESAIGQPPWWRKLARETIVGRFMLVPVRLWRMLQVTVPPLWHGLVWTVRSREHYNYTYNLTPRNLKHLAALLATVAECSRSEIENYLRELEGDTELRNHILNGTLRSRERLVADFEVRYGRRLGWYALVRAKKPRVVVETGVDKGLGSVVLASALLRNAAEGHEGQLIGIDIDPNAGYLLNGPYAKAGKVVFKDSLQALRELSAGVDLFIHDSDHNPEFEAAEYRAVQPKLAAGALVLSDNADHTDELLAFAQATGRKFVFFCERPERHWWPGEGIGIAY